MQDIVFSFDLTVLAVIFLIVFPCYYLAIKKQIYSWFDPLLAFVFFNSISIAFVIYLYFFMHQIKLFYFITFCLSILGFILGIIWGGKGGLTVYDNDVKEIKNSPSKNYQNLLDVFLFLSLLVLILSNLIMLIFKGTLPIFSANPSEAKIVLYTGGWGIVRRINFALCNFVLAIPLINILHPAITISIKKCIYYLLALLICVLVLITMGSKSSLLVLLNVLFAMVMVNKTSGLSSGDRLKANENLKRIFIWAKYAFFVAVALMFIVILKSGVETTASDTLITRLVSSGDAFYFFYVFDLNSDFKTTAFNYLPHILNPVLGMLRVTEYEYPIGAYILSYSFGQPLDVLSTFGPNAQHPIEGLIYFGKYGVLFYSFFIGYIISTVRIRLLRKLGSYPNYLKILAYVILSSIIIDAATDFPFFLTVFYDSVIFGLIFLFIALVISEVLLLKLEPV